jgi:hypothetical protein
MAGHHHHGHGQQIVADPFLEQRQAVDIRHPDIQQDQVGRLFLACGARLFAVLGEAHLVSFVFQYFLQQVANTGLVIHHQDFTHPHSPALPWAF